MKKLLYLFYVLIVIIVFLPKKELYYTAETWLQKEDIYLSGETFSGGWFMLDVENIQVLAGSSALADIEQIRMVPWIVVNDFYLDSIKASEHFAFFFPGQIDRVRLRYALWNPLEISIEITGDFGHAHGDFDLVEQKLTLFFDALPQMRNYPLLVSKLHPQEGGLVYERVF